MKEGEIMDGTEVAVKLEAHEHEIDSLKHRIKDLEVQNKTIQENAISVTKMAVSMDNISGELGEHKKRLEMLERIPVETGKTVKAAIITALAGGVVGSVVTAVVSLL